MKLTNEDKDYLLDIGYLHKDFPQIERAGALTIYYHLGYRIGRDKVIELIGREAFLSGLARSAFHWSAVQGSAEIGYIYYNSHRLFEGGI